MLHLICQLSGEWAGGQKSVAMAAETWTADKDLGVSAQSTEDIRRALGLHGSPGREDREEAEL